MHLDIPKLGDSIVGISSIIYIYIYISLENQSSQVFKEERLYT